MPPARSPRGACSASIAPDPLRPGPAVRARTIRWFLLALVAIGLAPGTFLRTPTALPGDPAVVTITALKTEVAGVTGSLEPTGIWELTAPHGRFGGFSALVAVGEDALIAGSDRGWLLDLDLSGPAPRAVPGSFRFVGRRLGPREELVDLESLARDPATGALWAGFENHNLIERFAADGTRTARAPAQMARWSRNSGAETMERLADGRFVLIAEGPERGSNTAHRALLFPGDPVEKDAPLAFRFLAPPDYDPVDATQLADGRVLILLRRVEYALPARFDTAIAMADPGRIRAGETWQGQILARLGGPLLGENFEGIAVLPDPDDPAREQVWLIADDNFSIFQRSLLVRFDWRPPSVAQTFRFSGRPASPPLQAAGDAGSHQ